MLFFTIFYQTPFSFTHLHIYSEMKFPSFPDLIKAITNDVQTAKSTLDFEPYTTLSDDPFLTKNDVIWVGKTGGDDAASYEFDSTVEFLLD